jgi:hypothetical protein
MLFGKRSGLLKDSTTANLDNRLSLWRFGCRRSGTHLWRG